MGEASTLSIPRNVPSSSREKTKRSIPVEEAYNEPANQYEDIFPKRQFGVVA
ncbi:hypothetical protein HAX54_015798, partial [Datura stramonium]|nr:hypothetical protein [Datura stramonium]